MTGTQRKQASFPKLEYPINRDEPPKTAQQWLQGKVIQDGAEGLWRVHNSLYDLSDFILDHPGGREWIEITKGTDVTEAFETHHLKGTAETLLPKYFVRKAIHPRNSPFTFKEDGFYKTLKLKVAEKLKEIPRDTRTKSDIVTDCLLISLLILGPLACWMFKRSWILTAGLVLINGFVLSSLITCAHNYFHRADSWRMYLFNIGGSSFTFINNLRKKSVHWSNLIPLMYPTWMWWISGTDITSTLLVWAVSISSASFYFMVFGLTAGHHDHNNFFEGDVPREQDIDWGIHQLDTVVEREEYMGNYFLSVTRFGDHAIHHLFPTLDHAELDYLYPTVLDHCKKYDIEFRTTNFYSALLRKSKQIMRNRPHVFRYTPPKNL